MVLQSHGTDLVYGATRGLHRASSLAGERYWATRCPHAIFPTEVAVNPPVQAAISLRRCYGMSGTDIAHGHTAEPISLCAC
eukprot:1535561-Rhodomonas_salina.3